MYNIMNNYILYCSTKQSHTNPVDNMYWASCMKNKIIAIKENYAIQQMQKSIKLTQEEILLIIAQCVCLEIFMQAFTKMLFITFMASRKIFEHSIFFSNVNFKLQSHHF